ncbi:MAG: 2-phospho-L-lactate transferase CofD family protein [Novosphingobium sp.]
MTAPRILCLTGGIGGAKLARGLMATMPPEDLAFAVNTGDDFTHLGMEVWPDFDTLVYTLAGLANPVQGWGRKDETWAFHEELGRLGSPDWFRLGDRDLALHAMRTQRLREGQPRGTIAQAIVEAFGLRCTIWRAARGELATRVVTAEGELAFQEYFVARQAKPVLTNVRFAPQGTPGPEPDLAACLAENTALEGVIIAPSNPVLSIAPILAVDGLRAMIGACPAPVIAVSPIVGGESIKGPTAKIFAELGREISPVTVAREYKDMIDGIVIDPVDRELAGMIEDLGLACHIAPIVMQDDADKEAVARECLSFIDGLSARKKAP